ncbi:hypothetical protein BJX63DRAFT_411689 [Aspergillus granulosus]|uniref:Uncharacterized protein n=1 Tax=Aspergillus granulosus TaxID=176169 RepID=A0ABR4GXB2_9EURO
MAGKCRGLLKHLKYEIYCPCAGFEALSEQLQPGHPNIICRGCGHRLSQHGPTSLADIQPATDKLITLQQTGEADSATARGKKKRKRKRTGKGWISFNYPSYCNRIYLRLNVIFYLN